MSAPKNPPLLTFGPLSHRIYLVTRYKVLEGGIIEATGAKVDVTDQVGRVLAEMDAAGLELRPKPKAEAA